MGILRRWPCGVLAMGLVFAATGMACEPGVPHPGPPGPPEGPTVDVAIPLASVCPGAPASFTLAATLPEWVRAGRPFSVSLSLPGFPPKIAQAGLDLTGATTPQVAIAVPGNAYVVAAPGESVGISIRQLVLGVADSVGRQQLITCAPATPVPLATTEVRHARRTAAADITAAQHVGVWCEDPSKFPFGTFEDVSATLPNQAQAGVPFTITITGTTRAAAIGVTGGTVDGATVTPTGPQGTTVDVTYLLDSFGDPDFPFRACNQLAGPVHLATIPIVRH